MAISARRTVVLAVVLGALATALLAAAPTGAANQSVVAAGTSFQPSISTVNVGDTVTWTGVTGAHTVTASSANWTINSASDTSFTFTAPGTYDYVCGVHGPAMSGRVVVQPAGGATTTSTPSPTNTPAPPTSTPSPAAPIVTYNPNVGALVGRMTGAAENPPNATTGSGTVVFGFDAPAGAVAGAWDVSGLGANIISAHIHRATAGVNGPIVVPFSGLPAGTGGRFTTTNSGVATSLIQEILANPSGFYVNVHTSANTGGEIRAQLERPRTLLPIAARSGGLGSGDVAVYPATFYPRTLTVRAGTTVRWFDQGTIHTVTSDATRPDGTRLFNSDAVYPEGIRPGQEYAVTFADPGTYPYFCQLHGAPGGVGHSGTIVVTP